MAKGNNGLSDHPLVVGIGTIAALLTIFVLITGYESLPGFLQKEAPTSRSEQVDEPTIIMPLTLSYAEKLCPIAIKQNDVDTLTIEIADPETVKSYIANFDSARIGDAGAFPKDTSIPAGVVVATNFDEQDVSKWSQYPVIPIIRSGSYGLFQTVGDYTAPNSGACRVIVP